MSWDTAAESDGADGDADGRSTVVHRERFDWERYASRRAAVGLAQAGDGPGLEVAEAVELVHAGDGPIGRGGDERACEVRGCDGRGSGIKVFRVGWGSG